MVSKLRNSFRLFLERIDRCRTKVWAPLMERTLRSLIALAVLMMWCVSLVVGLVTHDYEGVQITTSPMMIVCGWAFGAEIMLRRKERNDG